MIDDCTGVVGNTGGRGGGGEIQTSAKYAAGLPEICRRTSPVQSQFPPPLSLSRYHSPPLIHTFGPSLRPQNNKSLHKIHILRQNGPCNIAPFVQKLYVPANPMYGQR